VGGAIELRKPVDPTQSEAPFLVVQFVVMALFVMLGILAAKRFHTEPVLGVVAFG